MRMEISVCGNHLTYLVCERESGCGNHLTYHVREKISSRARITQPCSRMRKRKSRRGNHLTYHVRENNIVARENHSTLLVYGALMTYAKKIF